MCSNIPSIAKLLNSVVIGLLTVYASLYKKKFSRTPNRKLFTLLYEQVRLRQPRKP